MRQFRARKLVRVSRRFGLLWAVVAMPAVLLINSCNTDFYSPTLSLAGIPLSADVTNAMDLAIEDEYKARATYDAVIANLGPVIPFVRIREAEASHIEALRILYARHGLAAPADPYTAPIEVPGTLAESCRLGVEAEVANIVMYDQLLASITVPDVVRVFEQLRAASRDNHLPTFRSCS